MVSGAGAGHVVVPIEMCPLAVSTCSSIEREAIELDRRSIYPLLPRLLVFPVACPLPLGADKVDSAEGMATLEAMSSHHNFRPGQQNKLVSEPPIAAPDEHAPLVEADQDKRALYTIVPFPCNISR